MSDRESIRSTISQALTHLSVALDERGPLSVASALESAASAVKEIRRYQPSLGSERAYVSELIELMQRVAVVLHALAGGGTSPSPSP